MNAEPALKPVGARTVRAPRGKTLNCRSWLTEAPFRMIQNNLDPEVAEHPDRLVVYGGIGKAARNWEAFDTILSVLRRLKDDESLLVQSGKPVGVFRTHPDAPRVLIANSNLVPHWATWEHFHELDRKGLMMFGQMTAGSWIYIGSQGIVQGTYETFGACARAHFGGDARGRWILTAGLGGMGGAQPLAGRMAGAVMLCVEIDEERIRKRMAIGFLEARAHNLDDALEMVARARAEQRATSIGLLGNAADVYEAILARRIIPDVVTDQTSAHDLVYGYVPASRSLAEARAMRESDPETLMAESRISIVRHVRAMLGFLEAGAVVFDNGNLIRTQAREGGVENAFAIPIFTEAFLRPLFCRAIGPFRWIALSNDRDDIGKIDDYVLSAFPDNRIVTNWIALAREHVPFEGLPARIAWLGHGERTRLGLAVNRMVREGMLSGPVAFTRDHLDAGAMAHPNIMTERMRDGSDAIADWPLINALAMCSSQADLVAIHSGGGGYSGYMTSAGVTIIADGTAAADERLSLSLTNDTSLGVMRYADAGYDEALDEVQRKGVRHFDLGAARASRHRRSQLLAQ